VRVVLDWVLTIAGAILIVFALKAWIVNPYGPVLVDGADAALREADGGLRGALQRPRARNRLYTASATRSARDHRLQTPPEAKVRCGAGGTSSSG